MNEHDMTSAVNGGAEDLQAKAGKAQAMIGDVADKVAASVTQAGDQASAAVSKLSDGAIDAYDRASASARKMGDALEPFVQERPYAALGIAAALGLVAGLLMTGRGPKVVYVRPPR